jgi:hypothetical protein
MAVHPKAMSDRIKELVDQSRSNLHCINISVNALEIFHDPV